MRNFSFVNLTSGLGLFIAHFRCFMFFCIIYALLLVIFIVAIVLLAFIVFLEMELSSDTRDIGFECSRRTSGIINKLVLVLFGSYLVIVVRKIFIVFFFTLGFRLVLDETIRNVGSKLAVRESYRLVPVFK
jgi:hypothetical protein